MERFRSILVTTSPGQLDPSGWSSAVGLARTNRAHLTVMDVVDPVPRRRRTAGIGGRSVDLQDVLLQDGAERLRRLVDDHVDGAVPVTVQVRAGKAFVEVIQYVFEHDIDLVIVGQESPGADESDGLAPDVLQLLRKCPAPIWVMRPTLANERRVLALLDPDREDAVRDSLNRLVLELATSLARLEGADLHLAHAWELEGESTLRSSPFASLPKQEVDAMRQSTRREQNRRLTELADRHGVRELGGQIHLVEGPPGTVLPRAARQLDITVIVMGTVARTGLSGLIVGNTAETILRSVDSSVLAVKPEGFESPVRPAVP